MAFDSPDRLAREAYRRNDACRACLAGPVGIVDDHRAAQALRHPTAEFSAGKPQIFPQEVVHRQFVAYLKRSVDFAIDRDAHLRH